MATNANLMRQANAMRAHFTALNKLYGAQTLVNLIKQKGREKPVKDAYERYVDEVCLFPLVVEVLCNN
jgi:hypothetical protein